MGTADDSPSRRRCHSIKGRKLLNMAGYIRTWVTPAKLKLFGWRIKSELKSLNTKELTDAAEVLGILSGMVTDEMKTR